MPPFRSQMSSMTLPFYFLFRRCVYHVYLHVHYVCAVTFVLQDIDETVLNGMVKDTNVLNTKEYMKWNWNLIFSLLQVTSYPEDLRPSLRNSKVEFMSLVRFSAPFSQKLPHPGRCDIFEVRVSWLRCSAQCVWPALKSSKSSKGHRERPDTLKLINTPKRFNWPWKLRHPSCFG